MEIEDLKQGIYEAVTYILGVQPKYISHMTHTVDKVFIHFKNGEVYTLTIEQDEIHCSDSDMDLFSNDN